MTTKRLIPTALRLRTPIEAKQPDAFGGRIRVLFEDARPVWLQDDLLAFLEN